jgi:hypothetical protein
MNEEYYSQDSHQDSIVSDDELSYQQQLQQQRNHQQARMG